MAAAASAQQLALRLLGRREHTRAELRRKLLASSMTAIDVDAALDELAAQGLQSDLRFAEAFIHAKRANFGKARLKQELQLRGVSANIISTALSDAVDESSELQRARAIWQKKFGVLPATLQEKGRQMRFMHSRGFDGATLRRLLQSDDDSDL